MADKSFCYDYPRPAVTCDVAVIYLNNNVAEVLLIQRKNDPFKDCWALPGGFLDKDETCENGAKRELSEETGIAAENLELVCMGDTPGRDPRGWVISAVYCSVVSAKPNAVAADDAIECAWFRLDKLPSLAFDHDKIMTKISNFISSN